MLFHTHGYETLASSRVWILFFFYLPCHSRPVSDTQLHSDGFSIVGLHTPSKLHLVEDTAFQKSLFISGLSRVWLHLCASTSTPIEFELFSLSCVRFVPDTLVSGVLEPFRYCSAAILHSENRGPG